MTRAATLLVWPGKRVRRGTCSTTLDGPDAAASTDGGAAGDSAQLDAVRTSRGRAAPAYSFLTTFGLDETVDDTLDAGADCKQATPEQLSDGIRTVFAGDGEDPGLGSSVSRLGVRDMEPGRRVDLPHRLH